jgi:glycosyltransferase involved in cell wall biosynthesis
MSKTVNPLVTIIVIDYKKINPYLIECLDAIQKQTFKNYEVILETDFPLVLKYPRLKIVDYHGKYTPPAKKRDHGALIAKGKILAFIDDDASPNAHWLEKIVPHFNNKNIVGIGGPGVTPPDVTWQEAASGWVSASPIGAGPYTYRFLPGIKQFVDDYPSMNLSVRKEDFEMVGGYDSNFWPGEDTKLCLDLIQKTGKKIIYDPNVVVYHHRRPLWRGHLKQNGGFGLHRGFFARILPETSLRPIYFLPSIMLLGLCFILISLPFNIPLISFIRQLGLIIFGLYIVGLVVNALWIFNMSKSVLQSLVSIPAIFVTHLWYGTKFIQGYLFTVKLKR